MDILIISRSHYYNNNTKNANQRIYTTKFNFFSEKKRKQKQIELEILTSILYESKVVLVNSFCCCYSCYFNNSEELYLVISLSRTHPFFSRLKISI